MHFTGTKPAITLECVGILKIFCLLALVIRFTFCTDTTCTTLEAQKQRSGNQKSRRIRPKPSMILYQFFILVGIITLYHYALC